MNNEILKIDHVSKKYRLGMIGGTTLRDELQRKRAERKGLDDPTAMIGSKSSAHMGEEFLALNDICISVKQGERVGIIGHNGAGKSTLLKLISRITAPSNGRIEMNGRVASMLEVGTGFHPELTGRENIYMNGAILGMTKAEIDSKIEDIIDFSECRKFIDTPVKRYSSGMYVKLAFSVAAHLDSEIMIMDEVLAVGDMAFQQKCLDKMSQVSQNEGRTILYVSHNMNTIRQLCERCIVLNHGQVDYDGDVETAIDYYMGTKVADWEPKHVFTSKEHDSMISNSKIIESIFFPNCSSNIFQYGSKVKFDITVKTERDWQKIGFRFEVKGSTGIVGTFFSDKTHSYSCDNVYTVHLAFDTTHIVQGKYTVDIVAYQLDGNGNQIRIEGVYPGFAFEISDRIADDNKLLWLHRYWGNVKLHDAIIESVEVNERHG